MLTQCNASVRPGKPIDQQGSRVLLALNPYLGRGLEEKRCRRALDAPCRAIWDNMPAVLGTIKQFFDKHIAPHPVAPATDREQRLRIATSAILIEMTRADFEVKPEELASVTEAVQTTFAISPAETQELLRLAEQEARQATDFYQFTSLINRSFTPEEKTRVIELMWQVAYADGRADKYEDHLVRKIAGLLHVSHKDFIAAKQRARQFRSHASEQ